jgi:hypothetical protein
MGERVRSLGGTAPISHTGPSDRFSGWLGVSFPLNGKSGWFNPRTEAARCRSRFHLEIEAVKSHRQSAEEQQGREVLRHQGKGGSRQRNLKGTGVPGGKIVNHTSEKHIKKAAAHLSPAVRSPALRQLQLRNGLAAERALPQMRREVLAAKHASLRVRGVMCRSPHTGSNTPLSRLGSHSWRVKGLHAKE